MSDWLLIMGIILVIAGLGAIYWPLALIAGGVATILVAIATHLTRPGGSP